MNPELAAMIRSTLNGSCSPEVLADFCEERDRLPFAEKLRAEVAQQLDRDDYYWRKYQLTELLEAEFLPESLRGYDWKEAFGYAGEWGTNAGAARVDRALPNDDISTATFTRFDVKEVLAASEGENDGPEWLMAGVLWDGRFFLLAAGCDYTGWG